MSLEFIFQWYHKNSVRLDVTWALNWMQFPWKVKRIKRKGHGGLRLLLFSVEEIRTQETEAEHKRSPLARWQCTWLFLDLVLERVAWWSRGNNISPRKSLSFLFLFLIDFKQVLCFFQTSSFFIDFKQDLVLENHFNILSVF